MLQIVLVDPHRYCVGPAVLEAPRAAPGPFVAGPKNHTAPVDGWGSRARDILPHHRCLRVTSAFLTHARQLTLILYTAAISTMAFLRPAKSQWLFLLNESATRQRPTATGENGTVKIKAIIVELASTDYVDRRSQMPARRINPFFHPPVFTPEKHPYCHPNTVSSGTKAPKLQGRLAQTLPKRATRPRPYHT